MKNTADLLVRVIVANEAQCRSMADRIQSLCGADVPAHAVCCLDHHTDGQKHLVLDHINEHAPPQLLVRFLDAIIEWNMQSQVLPQHRMAKMLTTIAYIQFLGDAEAIRQQTLDRTRVFIGTAEEWLRVSAGESSWSPSLRLHEAQQRWVTLYRQHLSAG